jgi:hypothetical protein
MDDPANVILWEDILRKLAYQRGVLTLLKDTDHFSPLIEKALEDIDYILDKVR